MAPGARLEEIRDVLVVAVVDLDLLGHHRSADEVALRLVAVVLLQKVVLPWVLDAFGHHAQLQAVRHLNGGVTDRGISLVAG